MSCVLAYSPPGDAQGLALAFVFLFHAQKILVHLQAATWIQKVRDHKFMHSTTTQYLLAQVCGLCVSMYVNGRRATTAIPIPPLPSQKSLDRPPYIALGRGPSQWSTCEDERLEREHDRNISPLMSDLLGMVKSSVNRSNDTPSTGSKGNFEWSGDQFYMDLNLSFGGKAGKNTEMHKPRQYSVLAHFDVAAYCS